jgi:hypothetical protein
MNLGQTLLTLGMFVLLIMTVISANRLMMEDPVAALNARAVQASSSIANDLFREITSKPFDQNVVNPRSDTTKLVWSQDSTGTMYPYLANFGGVGTPATFDTTRLTAYGKWSWGARRGLVLPDSSYIGSYKSITGLKDVDDYDGYRRIVDYDNTLKAFTLSVKVYYVLWATPDVQTTTRSVFKRIDVTVTQTYLTDPAVYTAIVSY